MRVVLSNLGITKSEVVFVNYFLEVFIVKWLLVDFFHSYVEAVLDDV